MDLNKWHEEHSLDEYCKLRSYIMGARDFGASLEEVCNMLGNHHDVDVSWEVVSQIDAAVSIYDIKVL